MRKVVTAINAGWGKYDVIIKGIAAWQCEQCAEEEYDSKEIEFIEAISRAYSQIADRPEILNVEDVADLLRVSKQTIYNLIKAGKLPAVKIDREWRFSRETILECLKIASDQNTGAPATIAARLLSDEEGIPKTELM